MSKKKKETAEFRFYDLPQDEAVLALMGKKWIQIYGEGISNLHFHNLFEIGICYYGTGDLVIEEDTYRFDGGMMSFIPSNFLHVTRSDKNVYAFWEFMFLSPEEILKELYPHNIQKVKEMLDLVNKKAAFIKESENPELSRLVRMIFEEMGKKRPFYQEIVKSLATSLVLTLARANKDEKSKNLKIGNGMQLDHAVEFVEANYARNFKISELAAACHMSETHFRRVFQERMNMTPVEYINFVRIKKACELIDKTDISMEEVAEKVGFVTPSTFNRNFRRIIGTSPYQWKKRPDNHEGKLIDYKISALKGW